MRINLQKYNAQCKLYTELRAQENRNLHISMVNGTIMGNSRSVISGVSARVFHNGYWGFSSNPLMSDATVKQVINAATENATFLSKRLKAGAVNLPSCSISSDNDFTTTKARGTQKDRIDFMQAIDAFIVKNCPKVSSRIVVFSQLDMEKNLFTSDGSIAYSLIPRALLYVVLTVEADGVPYELHEAYGGFGEFEDNFSDPSLLFPRIIEQYNHLVYKSEGVYATSGIKDCILDADLAGILAHEAIGHTTEADGVMGGSIAGDYLGKEVASPLVTLVDFAHHALGDLCPVPVFVDDEGTKATDTTIIEEGILKGFMHNKESANHFGAQLTGNARAYAFYDEPLIRMRNTAIIPGNSKLDDMIASIEDGYYLMKSSNGQADSTSEFMFGVVLGYEIKNGKLGNAIKDTTISGVAFDVLKTISQVSDDMVWTCSGMCGKKQSIPVGMGGPAITCKVTIGGK
jgi:TldD protein